MRAVILIHDVVEIPRSMPQFIPTGGGSDANAFQARGFPCVNLANGTEANHTPDESVSVWALDKMLDVTRRLLARAAEC